MATANPLNRDPLTQEPGSHPFAATLGSIAGLSAGMSVGSLAGFDGSILGIIIGGVAGGLMGKGLGESASPSVFGSPEVHSFWIGVGIALGALSAACLANGLGIEVLAVGSAIGAFAGAIVGRAGSQIAKGGSGMLGTTITPDAADIQIRPRDLVLQRRLTSSGIIQIFSPLSWEDAKRQLESPRPPRF